MDRIMGDGRTSYMVENAKNNLAGMKQLLRTNLDHVLNTLRFTNFTPLDEKVDIDDICDEPYDFLHEHKHETGHVAHAYDKVEARSKIVDTYDGELENLPEHILKSMYAKASTKAGSTARQVRDVAAVSRDCTVNMDGIIKELKQIIDIVDSGDSIVHNRIRIALEEAKSLQENIDRIERGTVNFISCHPAVDQSVLAQITAEGYKRQYQQVQASSNKILENSKAVKETCDVYVNRVSSMVNNMREYNRRIVSGSYLWVNNVRRETVRLAFATVPEPSVLTNLRSRVLCRVPIPLMKRFPSNLFLPSVSAFLACKQSSLIAQKLQVMERNWVQGMNNVHKILEANDELKSGDVHKWAQRLSSLQCSDQQFQLLNKCTGELNVLNEQIVDAVALLADYYMYRNKDVTCM